jgi:hypothetical protein
MVNRISEFEQMLMFSSFFSKNKSYGKIFYTKRSVLKREIKQCKTQWNTILNKGAKDNRTSKFEHKVTGFFKFFGFFSKTKRVTVSFYKSNEGS